MKKYPLYIIIALMFIFTSINMVYSDNETCIISPDNRTLCMNYDANIYRQNIGLWDGNDGSIVNAENPSTDLNKLYFQSFVKSIEGSVTTGSVDIGKLGDDTTFSYQSPTDFYNSIQQQNTKGNITLFTQKDLNLELRGRTNNLTSVVLDWTLVLILVLVELIKIFLYIFMFILFVFMLFRLLPKSLHLVKIIIFKVISGRYKKQ